MRIVALIDDREVIERILRHLGLWNRRARDSATGHPGKRSSSPGSTTLPDYDTEPVTVHANG